MNSIAFRKKQRLRITTMALLLALPPVMATNSDRGIAPMEPLIEHLQLRDEQIEPVLEILEAQHAQHRELNDEIRYATLHQLAAVLDSEQMALFASMPPPPPPRHRRSLARRGAKK